MSALTQAAKRVVPGRLYYPARSVCRRLSQFGFARYCPVCRSRLRQFLPFGQPERREARCPTCGSLERHRLAWLYFRERTDLFDGEHKRMLHVAPEPQLAKLLREEPQIDYLSGDVSASDAMVRLDITDIAHPDDSFDVVYCSHVLEHVRDDRRAMREVFRVLRPGGWAILQVPILGEQTLEDWSIETPEDRERVFGQRDHVRVYGKDYADRLADAGFVVTVDPFVRGLGAQRIRYYGLDAQEDIYLCRKPVSLCAASPEAGATVEACR